MKAFISLLMWLCLFQANGCIQWLSHAEKKQYTCKTCSQNYICTATHTKWNYDLANTLKVNEGPFSQWLAPCQHVWTHTDWPLQTDISAVIGYMTSGSPLDWRLSFNCSYYPKEPKIAQTKQTGTRLLSSRWHCCKATRMSTSSKWLQCSLLVYTNIHLYTYFGCKGH